MLTEIQLLRRNSAEMEIPESHRCDGQIDVRDRCRSITAITFATLDISDPGVDILGSRNIYLARSQPETFLLLNAHRLQSHFGRGIHAHNVAVGPAVQKKNHSWRAIQRERDKDVSIEVIEGNSDRVRNAEPEPAELHAGAGTFAEAAWSTWREEDCQSWRFPPYVTHIICQTRKMCSSFFCPSVHTLDTCRIWTNC